MKWRKISKQIWTGLIASYLALSGCGSNKTNTLIVTVLPSSATVVVKQQQSFSASVTGATNTNVTWTLTISGNSCTPGCGTLDSTTNTTITYTAPATIPSALVPAAGSTTPAAPLTLTAISAANSKKTGTATITLDSGIRVASVLPSTATIAAGSGSIVPEHLPFSASVNDTAGVTWLVTQATTINSGSASCDPGCGHIDTTGFYTAPKSLPTSTTVTVVAVSKTDTTRFASATITLVDPTKNIITFAPNGISPPTAPLGGLQQDVYLNVTNLRTTITVLFDGVPIDPTLNQLKIINASVARLRLNSKNLSIQQVPGTHTIGIRDQHGNTQTENFQIVAARPALVSAVPDSFGLSTTLPGTIVLDGGFFGDPTTKPIVTAQFSNNNLSKIPTPGSRQLTIPLDVGDLGVAGLFPVSVVNNNIATPNTATTNVAVQPDLVTKPAKIIVTLPLAGTAPSAIAVDSSLGLAVVTEQTSNSVQIVSLAGGTLTAGTRVTSGFNQPTGVAIDDQLATHVAAIANSGDNSLTILQVPSGSFVAKVSFAGLLSAGSGSTTPFAVGIDPFTHLALVAFSNANMGFIVNVDQSNNNPGCIGGTSPPFCPVSSVTLNTGAKPQIAFEPRLHLAFVTPGGLGLMSAVDLTRKNSVIPIASPSASGAIRASNIVTIKTTSAHNINPAVGGTVLITGVSPSDFNGAFPVSNVIDTFTFTYAQTGPNETGGGGSVGFGSPDFTFSISNTNQGIAINPESRTAILADPNASIGQISFISTLDESVTSLTLNAGSFLNNPTSAPEIGATWVAFQPFTNVAVSFNPSLNAVSFIDPAKPQRLAQAFNNNTGAGQVGCSPASCSSGAITGALAVDPVTNLALVVNSGSNSVVAISIGDTPSMKQVHINQVQLFTAGGAPYLIPGALLPQAVLSTNSTLPTGVAFPVLGTIKILGTGFASGATVTLDSTVVPSSFVTSNEIDVSAANIPANLLAGPRHFALEVSSGGILSNAADFTVVQTIDASKGCSGTSTPQPGAVAIDEQRDIAVVANSGCNDVSIIDLTPGAAAPLIKSVAVGKSPAAVAVIPRLGLAVVTNNGAGTASILDISTPANAKEATSDVTVGASPLGVAINQDTGAAVIANNGSSNVSLIDLTVLNQSPPGTPKAVNGSVDTQPIAVAIDPDRGTNGHGLAVVTSLVQSGISAPTGVLDVVDIGTGTPVKNSNVTASFLTATPAGIVFDAAVSPGLFYVTESDGNLIGAFNPDSGQVTPIRVGINPTSIAYNLEAGTILTVNTASNTISVIDSQSFKTRGTFGISGSPQFAAAIHPLTNMAVIADQANNRVILYPLPK